ncbi:MAG: permease [Myxococcales bacterium]|nr:permease [Myxococcales bacterium]MCH7867294.1 permease [Myxococcales bacterium]
MPDLGLDRTLAIILGLLGFLSAIALWQGGEELLRAGLGSGGRLLIRFSLLIAVSFLVAGLAEKLVPHAWVEGALGDEAGIRGLFVATAAGIVTPSGPFLALPIAAALFRSGASLAAVVTFVSSWSLLALHRLVAWEIPLLGWRFALIRYSASIALPLAAGLIVRLLLGTKAAAD